MVSATHNSRALHQPVCRPAPILTPPSPTFASIPSKILLSILPLCSRPSLVKQIQ